MHIEISGLTINLQTLVLETTASSNRTSSFAESYSVNSASNHFALVRMTAQRRSAPLSRAPAPALARPCEG
jgi:hypothetical protein